MIGTRKTKRNPNLRVRNKCVKQITINALKINKNLTRMNEKGKMFSKYRFGKLGTHRKHSDTCSHMQIHAATLCKEESQEAFGNTK